MTDDAPTRLPRRSRWPRNLMIIAIVAGVVWLARGPMWDLIYSGAVVETLGSDQAVDVIRNAHQVTAQRMQLLDPDEQPHPDEDGFWRENYVPITNSVPVSESQAEELSRLLTSGRSFGALAYGEWGCAPTFGVNLQFQNGDERIDVWLCFECDVLTAVDDANNELHRTRSFQYIRNDLADIMRDLFPDDQAIQALGRR